MTSRLHQENLSDDTLAEARRLREVWRDEKCRHALAERVRGDDPRARVAIRHSSASSRDPFQPIACLDVYVNVRPPGGDSRSNYPATQSQVAYVRHFDAEGTELHLPQETFQFAKSYPARKKAPLKDAASAR